METSSTRKIGLAVLALLGVASIGAYIYQLMNGLSVTGLSNVNSWGLYIAAFMFFVGLSAGGMIVASSASIFNIEKFKQVSVPAVIVSTVSICIALVFILIDMGGVQRIWRLFTGPNFMSPLMWDVIVIPIYLIINILYLRWLTGEHADPRKVEILSRFALPVAILVHSVTAWIFGLQIAKAWYTAIMAPIFIASALDSGLALLLIALVVLRKFGIFEFSKDVFKTLAGLLAVFIAIDAFLIACEVITMAYPGAGESAALMEMLTGATAPYFWFEVIAGLLIPFLILVFAKNRESVGLVTLASVLVVLGVFAKRIWLLLTSFVHPNIVGAPGVAAGTSGAIAQHGPNTTWELAGSYLPTGLEVLIFVGVVSLGILAFFWLSKRFLGDTRR